MQKKKMQRAVVIEQTKLGEGIFSLWLSAPETAAAACAGQFVSLYCNNETRLLPRPISICEIDRAKGAIRLVYRVAGAGTSEFSGLLPGDTLDLMGPLGNGFPLKEAEGRRVLLIGGGIGIPPMLETAREISGDVMITAGYRDALFLTEELGGAGRLYIATEDGCAGTKGTVLDAIRENGLEADVIFACGPKPMLAAVKAYAVEKGIRCWISLEERMACGIGACLACVTGTVGTDEHTGVHNSRICREGPVFAAEEVQI